MSKEEVTLELVKLTLHHAIRNAAEKNDFDTPKITIDLYNQIFSSIQVSEPDKS